MTVYPFDPVLAPVYTGAKARCPSHILDKYENNMANHSSRSSSPAKATDQVAGKLIAREGNGSIHHQQQVPEKRAELSYAREKFMASPEGAAAAEAEAQGCGV